MNSVVLLLLPSIAFAIGVTAAIAEREYKCRNWRRPAECFKKL